MESGKAGDAARVLELGPAELCMIPVLVWMCKNTLERRGTCERSEMEEGAV